MQLSKKMPLLGLIAMMLASNCALAKQTPAEREIVRGRYLVLIGSCNDCHTTGYAEQGGKLAETEWLTGDTVGWQGPWGTTYSANLRLLFQQMSENAWLVRARHERQRPEGDLPLRAASGAQGQPGADVCGTWSQRYHSLL